MEKVMPIMNGSSRIIDENTRLEYDVKKGDLYRITKIDGAEEKRRLSVGRIAQEYDIGDNLIIYQSHFYCDSGCVYIPYTLHYLPKEDKFLEYNIVENANESFMKEIETFDVKVNLGYETYLELGDQFNYEVRKVLKKNGKYIEKVVINGYMDKDGNKIRLRRNDVIAHVEIPSFKIISAYSTLKEKRYDAHNMDDIINIINQDIIDEETVFYGIEGLEDDISTVLLDKYLDAQEKELDINKNKTLTI